MGDIRRYYQISVTAFLWQWVEVLGAVKTFAIFLKSFPSSI